MGFGRFRDFAWESSVIEVRNYVNETPSGETIDREREAVNEGIFMRVHFYRIIS